MAPANGRPQSKVNPWGINIYKNYCSEVFTEFVKQNVDGVRRNVHESCFWIGTIKGIIRNNQDTHV
ncbi:hypothetical protein, partial [Aliiglaciecola lipolytica]|uniref:hypothetical protein n=1 Tax=Aliiglaciecola lipolytica TaxID=477689 RepID=UPI001C08FBCF